MSNIFSNASLSYGLLVLLITGLIAGCSIKEVEGVPGIAEIGDPCAEHGSYACSENEDMELICEEGWFRESQSCDGGCEIVTNEDKDFVLLCKDENGAPR